VVANVVGIGAADSQAVGSVSCGSVPIGRPGAAKHVVFDKIIAAAAQQDAMLTESLNADVTHRRARRARREPQPTETAAARAANHQVSGAILLPVRVGFASDGHFVADEG